MDRRDPRKSMITCSFIPNNCICCPLTVCTTSWKDLNPAEVIEGGTAEYRCLYSENPNLWLIRSSIVWARRAVKVIQWNILAARTSSDNASNKSSVLRQNTLISWGRDVLWRRIIRQSAMRHMSIWSSCSTVVCCWLQWKIEYWKQIVELRMWSIDYKEI